MSLRMISDVLKPKDVETHCPLCGRSFARFPSDEEHIFPRWLQHHHHLWTRRLNIPNFTGKAYKSVKIRICKRCNGKTFGNLEARLAPVLTGADPFAVAAAISDDELAFWLGKIFWLLIRKSHSVPDFRTRNLPEQDRVLPNELLPGTLFLGMVERAYATANYGMSFGTPMAKRSTLLAVTHQCHRSAAANISPVQALDELQERPRVPCCRRPDQRLD
jgi:hypothetical protein